MNRETIKGVIFPHGPVEVGNETVYKYIVGFVALSKVKLDIPSETIIIDDRVHWDKSIMEVIGESNLFKRDESLGTLISGMRQVANISDPLEDENLYPVSNSQLTSKE